MRVLKNPRSFEEEFVTGLGTEDVPVVAIYPLASELVSVTGYQTLKDVTSKSCRCQIGLERAGKRGSCQVSIVEGPRKRPMTSDYRVKGQ